MWIVERNGMWNNCNCNTTVQLEIFTGTLQTSRNQFFLSIRQVVASMTIYLHNQLQCIGHLLGFQSPSSNEWFSWPWYMTAKVTVLLWLTDTRLLFTTVCYSVESKYICNCNSAGVSYGQEWVRNWHNESTIVISTSIWFLKIAPKLSAYILALHGYAVS